MTNDQPEIRDDPHDGQIKAIGQRRDSAGTTRHRLDNETRSLQ